MNFHNFKNSFYFTSYEYFSVKWSTKRNVTVHVKLNAKNYYVSISSIKTLFFFGDRIGELEIDLRLDLRTMI